MEVKTKTKITKESLQELGEWLYKKTLKLFSLNGKLHFTLQDCVDYIFNLTVNRTFDDFVRENSVVNDGLAKIFPK